ncbi:MAG TPA: hypothetical protein VGL87_11580 [Steroidobacteraceae bacterium]
MRLLTLAAALAAAALIAAAPLSAFAQQNSVAADPCARYKWDVTRERALFAAPASSITAAQDGRAPPRIATNRAYRVKLAPAAQVLFPTSPGKASPPEGNYSGVLAFDAPVTGNYRVAVDLPMWIDVVADARLLPASDYEGQHGCDAPRKIVQFALEAKKPLILQLSGASEAAVRVVIVRASGD